MEHVDDVPVALLVELTSDIQRLARRQPRAADPGNSAAADQRRRDDRVGGVEGRAGARSAGPQALMSEARRGSRPCRACCSSPACRARANRPCSTRSRTWAGTASTICPPRCSRISFAAQARRRRGADGGRNGRAQPRLRRRRPPRPGTRRSRASRLKSSTSIAPAASWSAAMTRLAAAIRWRPTARPKTGSRAIAG